MQSCSWALAEVGPLLPALPAVLKLPQEGHRLLFESDLLQPLALSPLRAGLQRMEFRHVVLSYRAVLLWPSRCETLVPPAPRGPHRGRGAERH